MEFAEECISPRDAVFWRWINKDHVRQVEVPIFWEIQSVYMPVGIEDDVDEEKFLDDTENFINYISELASDKIMKEKNFMIWKEFLKTYKLYNNEWHMFFVYEERQIEVWNSKIDSLQELKEIVAMKEFLDGLIKIRPYKVKWEDLIPYQSFDLATQNTTVHWAYTSSMREHMFSKTKYYNIIKPWETLQPRQWKAKLYEAWITSIIAPRRWWKTIFIWERAIEEITRDKQFQDKPVRVLIIGINKRKNKTIINYILNMWGPFIKNGYFKYDATRESMMYIEQWKQKKDDKVLGIIDFVGARDEDAWVGDYADMVIIDECERIPQHIRDDVFPIITNEWAKCMLVSTLNKRSQKTWFYEAVIKWEQEELKRSLIWLDPVTVIKTMWAKHIQPHINSWRPFEEWITEIDIDGIRKEMMMTRMWTALRFSWEDIDYLTDKEKDIARDNLRERWDNVYMPERWGIFPDEIKTYDYESSVKSQEYFINKQYKYIVVIYDPAESRDRAAIVIMWWDEISAKMVIIKTIELPPNYTFHGTYIKNIIEEREKKADRLFFIYDHNGVGHGLEPYLIEVWIRIDLKIKTAWWNKVTKTGNLHVVSKEFMVNITQNSFDHNDIIISDDCVILLNELDTYKGKYNEQTGNTKYAAEGKKSSDDFVACLMMWVYFMLEYMWEKYKIGKTRNNEVEKDGPLRLTDEERNKLYMEDLKNWKINSKEIIEWYYKPKQKRSLVLSKFWY